jgi:hypothetical protein
MKRRCPRRVHKVKVAHYVAPYGGHARISTSNKCGHGANCSMPRDRCATTGRSCLLRRSVNVLLQPLGDRQVERLDHVAPIGLRLSHQQKLVPLAVHEVPVALQICLVRLEAGCRAEEALELRHAHDRHVFLLQQLARCRSGLSLTMQSKPGSESGRPSSAITKPLPLVTRTMRRGSHPAP